MSIEHHVNVMNRRSFKLSALIYRAPDVDGQWIAHCAELDVISVGESPEHAASMICEAAALCIIDDLRDGLEPEDRGPNDEVDAAIRLVRKRGTRLSSMAEAVQHQELVTIAIEWLACVIDLAPELNSPCDDFELERAFAAPAQQALVPV